MDDVLERISQDDYFMMIAITVSKRGNCFRRQVGCVIVNDHNEILSTGYNGVPKGVPHCTRETCKRADKPSGSMFTDICPAVHAEANALLQCRNIWEIKRIYVTEKPCLICTSMLLNTGCTEIIYLNEYGLNDKPQQLWLSGNKPIEGFERIIRKHVLSETLI